METLPTLYKKAKTGKVTQSVIYTDGATVITETGYVGGVQTQHTYDALPKNTGKKNATTAEEQAIVEAKAKHVKALKSKYVTDPSGETTQKLPRKVGVYQDLFKTAKTQEKLNNTVYVEDKYNGVNGTYRYDAGLVHTSRGGELFPIPGHQMCAIQDVLDHFKLPALNVEQYTHGMHLQDIQSAVTKTNEDSADLTAMIFAFPEFPGTYEEQIPLKVKLFDYINEKNYAHIGVSIPTKVPALADGTLNKARIDELLADALSRGMEGIMVINGDHVYKYNEKSSSIWKYKIASDAEYKIIGKEFDKDGNITLVCESAGGTFKVRPKGDQASRDKMKAEYDEKYHGNWYKVEYETLSKAGKPTKPVGIGLRECDANGQPLV